MRYAFFNAAGLVETACNDDAVSELPVGAIGLTAEQFERRFELWLSDGVLSFLGIPAIPIGEAIAAIWNKIKAERDRRIQSGGYKVGEKWFHSDTFSRTQQMGLVMLGANIPPDTPWKTMDGSVEVMTPALAAQIFAAAAASDIAIFAAAEAHKAAMEASQDPSTYDFSAGWPAIYEA